MWERLEEQLGTLAAADAVCELVIATAPCRLWDLSDEIRKTGTASIRQNDSRLINLIFDWATEDISELGAYFFAYYHRREDPRNLDDLSRQGPQYLDPETLEPYSGPAYRESVGSTNTSFPYLKGYRPVHLFIQ
jgi:hypothetical protein